MDTEPKVLPIRYTLEIYETGFDNDPAVVFNSSVPFMAFSKGSYIHPMLWESSVKEPPGTWFKVKDVLHRVWEIDKSHIGHQVSLCIVPAKKPY